MVTLMRIDHYKIKDVYGGALVRESTSEGLTNWLKRSYTTLTNEQERMIDCLEESFEDGDAEAIKWFGVACGLEITKKKGRKRK